MQQETVHVRPPARAIARTWATRPSALIAIGALVAFTSLMVLMNGGAVLNFAFAPFALAVALILFRLNPSLYIEFVLWMWMLAPLVRRLADWHSGFHALSLIIVSPQVVTAVSGISVWNASKYLRSPRFAPYFAILVVLFWSYYVGILQNGLLPASYEFLNWACPVFFAIHLLVRAQAADEDSEAILRALTWGVLVTGVYGVYQFFAPSEWDLQWMLDTATEMNSIGEAFAQDLRIFSTLNSPGPFGQFIVVGLLALFVAPSRVRWLAMVPGVTALGLSLVRSAWGGFIVGFAVLFICLSMTRRLQIAITFAALVVITTFFLSSGPVGETIYSRFETIQNLEADSSYVARSEFYESFFSIAASSVIGVGLGKVGLGSRLATSNASLGEYGNFDSGIMSLFFTFGVLALPLVGLILFLFYRAAVVNRRTEHGAAFIAIAAAVLSEMVFSNTLTGLLGMFVLPMFALVEARAASQLKTVPVIGSLSTAERALAFGRAKL